METRGILAPVTLAVAIGVALWYATGVFTGRREAWDASAYWLVSYPLAIVVCACLGYVYPDRPWRWALVLFEAQFLAMCVRNGELGNLWPMGMALFAVVALPGIFAAKVASRFGNSSRERVE